MIEHKSLCVVSTCPPPARYNSCAFDYRPCPGSKELKNLTLPGWFIWRGGVKCFYREYKCLIFKVKELKGIELAFVKEYNILKDGQGTCCHDLNSYHWLYRSLKTTFNSGDTSRFALTLQWCTLCERHLHCYERWPFWCKAIHCTFFLSPIKQVLKFLKTVASIVS